MVTFFNRLNNCFFCKDAAGKPDGFLEHAYLVCRTCRLCSLYMLCLFPGKCRLVRCIFLTLQRYNPTKSQCPFMSVCVRLAEKSCDVTTIGLFPVQFCGGYGGLFYNLYNIILIYSFPLKGSTVYLVYIKVMNISSISSTGQKNADAVRWFQNAGNV